jgi:hypothetical protein
MVSQPHGGGQRPDPFLQPVTELLGKYKVFVF